MDLKSGKKLSFFFLRKKKQVLIRESPSEIFFRMAFEISQGKSGRMISDG